MKTELITKFTKYIVPKVLSLLQALTDSLPVLIFYLFTVLWHTVLNRAENYEIPQPELFWSFRKVLSGDPRLGIEIVGNVIMFMPFGFLLCDLFYKWNPTRISNSSAFSTSSSTSNVRAIRKSGGLKLKRYGKWFLIPLLALSFSLLIESLQLALVRGLAEADDLFTNTFGAVLGICTFELLKRLCGERLFEATPAIIKNTIRESPIQYQLWTTQLQNLPSDRLKKRHLWDNIGGYFEKYELSGNFGKYQVMCRELPTEYSIASILTGYYKKGEWDWANSFRPVYEF